MGNSEPRWIVQAKKYLGLHEGIGAADNPAVVAFYGKCGHQEIKHDAVPWCAAFIGGVLHDVNIKSTNSLSSLSYASWGTHLDKPLYGCVGVKHRGGVHSGLGHVTFILGETLANFLCLGGNQGDRVCIEAISKDGFFAYRWPPGEAIPKPPYPMLTSVPNLHTGLTEA